MITKITRITYHRKKDGSLCESMDERFWIYYESGIVREIWNRKNLPKTATKFINEHKITKRDRWTDIMSNHRFIIAERYS